MRLMAINPAHPVAIAEQGMMCLRLRGKTLHQGVTVDNPAMFTEQRLAGMEPEFLATQSLLAT